jgi:hypothetical protein
MRNRKAKPVLLACLLVACASPEQRSGGVAALRPYLSELIAATNAEFDEKGVFLGSSPHRARADALFEQVLATPSPAGDQSVAYLLFIYTGEHSGEELVCEAARRGHRMVPIIEAFSKQLPTTGLEPYPKFIQGSGQLPPEALRLIKAGETCGFE